VEFVCSYKKIENVGHFLSDIIWIKQPLNIKQQLNTHITDAVTLLLELYTVSFQYFVV